MNNQNNVKSPRKGAILFIGNHLSRLNQNPSLTEELSQKLEVIGWGVLLSSRRQNKILRLMDMAGTILIKSRQYDIAEVDVFSGQAFLWAEFCTSLLCLQKKPVVLTLHGGNLPEFSAKHPNRVRKLLKKAAIITVPSRYLHETMKQYRADLRIISNAIDINQYQYSQKINPRPELIWLRAFHKMYNPELAIHVLHQLHQEFPTMKLVMVGPDKGDGSLQSAINLVSDYGFEYFVQFPGSVSKTEVPVWLNKGDIFLNTTNVDNTPVSVIEAMACGLCVVSTNVGGIPYLIDNGSDGILTSPDNLEEMAEAVKSLLINPSLASEISKNAREKVEEFDWSKVIPLWEDIFESLL